MSKKQKEEKTSSNEATAPVMVEQKRAKDTKPKVYALDTNVFMDNPECLTTFEEHNIVFPNRVIRELDRHKSGHEARNHNSRDASKHIEDLQKNGKNSRGWYNLGLDAFGKKLGKFKILRNTKLQPDQTSDENIIATIKAYAKTHPQYEIILVSSDRNFRIYAREEDLHIEEYKHDSVEDLDILETPMIEMDSPASSYDTSHLKEGNLLYYDTYSKIGRQLYRYSCGRLKEVFKRNIAGLEPLSEEQIFAVDALTDKNLDLVILTGVAGSGKTLLTMAAAIAQQGSKPFKRDDCQSDCVETPRKNLKDKKQKNGGKKSDCERDSVSYSLFYSKLSNRYENVVISRPKVTVGGENIGAFPGDIHEKEEPYRTPIEDTLTYILKNAQKEGFLVDIKETDIKSMKHIDFAPIDTLRGRTFHHSFYLVDEAQNCEKVKLQTIISRAGKGTKVVITGDLSQIDKSFMTKRSCPLAGLINYIKRENTSKRIHINLLHSERSALAEWISKW
ncbi:phosphate starvation protein PhoH [candidate division SR1 bacterium]|nr:phosphate starvation protein PhoH [candidate division SR1 bacterium]